MAISVLPSATKAANLTFVSDTISTSSPGVDVNHTIKFTATNVIPASGKIIITPQEGSLTIPAGLGVNDVDFLKDGVNFALADTAGSGSGSAIGVSIITGTGGKITFTLNDTDPIASLGVITVKIGTNASFGGTGVSRIKNPIGVGSYRVTIETKDALGLPIDQAQTMIAILSPVRVGALNKPLATSDLILIPTVATTTTFLNPDGVKFMVEFPPNFVSFADDVHFQNTSFKKEDFVPAASPPSNKVVIGKVYDVGVFRVLDGSSITSFAASLIFDFFYLDSDVVGVDESTLQPYRLTGSEWTLVSGGTVLPNENRIRVAINHLSVFTLMGSSPPAPAPAPAPSPAPSGGGGGGLAAPSAPTTYTGVSGTATISPSSGGSAVRLNADGSSLTLTLPVQFWTSTVTFTVSAISQKTVLSVVPAPALLSMVGDQAWSILAKDAKDAAVTKFLKPAVIALRYTNAQAAGFDKNTFKIYALDQTLKKWEVLPDSAVDTLRNIVTGSANHLALFTIMGQAPRPVLRIADFNQDNRVDLVDFSILLYNWGAPKNTLTDINKDGTVDLIDFSILLYWWTG